MNIYQKLFTVLLFSLIVGTTGCSSDDSGNNSSANPLIGTWELTQGHGTYLGASVTIPASTIQLSMTIELKSDANYKITIVYQNETTFEDGTWQSNETTITLTAITGEAVIWPYTLNGNTLTTSVDTEEFGLRDLGITVISGVWDLYFDKQ